MATSVSAVYLHVIQDVIDKVRDEFLNAGAGDNVISELQALWEMKMMQCGVITGLIERPNLPKVGGPITPVHDLNVPYEGPEEYETPTAEMLFPPTPLQTPSQTPLPGTDHSSYNLPTGGPSDFPGGTDVKGGRPSPYMQPPSPWMNHRPLGVDVNVAYVEGRDEVDRGAGTSHPTTQDFLMMSSGKRKRGEYASHFQGGGYIPQQDGAGDTSDGLQLEAIQAKNIAHRSDRAAESSEMLLAVQTRSTLKIPQQDRVHDGFDDLFNLPASGNENYNTSAAHDQHVNHTVETPKPTKNESVDDDEPSLNEDDDDDDLDDLDQGEEEPNTQHLVLAQFDKVTRTKSRWKCMLKDGIMHFNGKDILFTKATGEFEF